MIHKLAFLIFILAQTSFMWGQHNDLTVIAAAGATFETEDLQLDWTLGEPVTLTFETPIAILTQGFHQPDYQYITSTYTPGIVGEISVIPNPVSTTLYLSLTFPQTESGTISIFDLSGHQVLEKSFSGESILECFDLHLLPSGSYILYTVVPNQHSFQTTSISKL